MDTQEHTLRLWKYSETVDDNVCAESDLETIADVGLPPEALPESRDQRCSNTSCTFVKHDDMTPHSDSTFGGKTGTANVSTRSAARSSVSFSTSISVFFSLIASATAHTSSFLSSVSYGYHANCWYDGV